jgi:hypothetical protein
MEQYCRFGWNCDRNNCNHCHVIHQRLCTDYGVSPFHTTPLSKFIGEGQNNKRIKVNSKRTIPVSSNCSFSITKVVDRYRIYRRKWSMLNKLNRKKKLQKNL